MTAQDLKAIQEMLQPQFVALGEKMDRTIDSIEKANDGHRESIRQLYEENKEIRATQFQGEAKLREEITAAASSARSEIAEHETRITAIEQWREGQKNSKTNWIALAGVLLMGLIFLIDKIIAALQGKPVV